MGRVTTRPSNAFRILITTVLSQRTKDETTDKISSRLFSKYKTPQDFLSIPLKELEVLIKQSGFYRVKAGRIKEISKILIAKFNSKVPDTIEELLSLPGVGRKTANCVLAFAFGVPALPVDTHVHRISNRLGLVKTKMPEETERALQEIIPEKYWGWLNKALVAFGKEICKPIGQKCKICELKRVCKYDVSSIYRKKTLTNAKLGVNDLKGEL